MFHLSKTRKGVLKKKIYVELLDKAFLNIKGEFQALSKLNIIYSEYNLWNT